MSWMLLASLGTAGAADTLIVARGLAEAWSDEAIGSVYRTGGLLGGAAVVVPIAGPIMVDVEAAYKRTEARDGAEDLLLEVIPITVVGEFLFPAPDAPLDPFVGVGVSMVAFAERHPPDADGFTVTRGARPTLELRAGLRVDLGLVDPPMGPARSAIKGVDLEVFGARRNQAPRKQGFDMGAWRAGLGLAVRL